MFAAGLLTDGSLNNIGRQTLNLAEDLDATYVYGAALSADGSLLFEPGDHSIDVFDGRTGSFRARVSVPVELSPNFRALVPNNIDNRLVAITGGTGNGIAVIDLRSLPAPSPPDYPSVSATETSVRPTGLHALTPGGPQPPSGFPQAPTIKRRIGSILK